MALHAGAVRRRRHHRRPGHRSQQGRSHRRLWHPRLRAHQPDRRLPAPTPERPAARRSPGDRREAAALRGPPPPPQDPGGQPQGQPPDPLGEGGPLRGAPREARRALQQPAGRSAGQGHGAFHRALRHLHRPGRHRRARAQVRALMEQGQQSRGRPRGRGRGRGRGHRHQPRARPHQPLHPTYAARSLAVHRRRPEGRRPGGGHRHQDRQLRRLRARQGWPRGSHPHQ